MQVLDMRTLRSILANKHLLNSNTQSLSSPRSCITFCKYSGNPSSSRYFRSTPERFIRSTNCRLSKEAADFDGPKGWTSSSSSWSSHSAPKNEKSREVSAIYDPITGRLVTRRVTNHHSDVAKESESSSGNKNSSLSSTDHEDGSRSRVYRNISNDTSSSAISGSKKKRKNKVTWVCSQCGYSDGQWWGICKECKTSGTMTQFSESPGENEKMSGFEASENLLRSWFPQQSAERPVRLTNVNKGISQINWRIPLFGLFGAEVARVLGGGLVPGSLILVGGDPGVGKSTLLLQIAAIVAETHHMDRPAPVVYVSGEESIEQIGDRADRMRIGTNELYVYASTDIEDILEKTQKLSPSLLVVDSIQTVYLLGVNGSAGGISQVKECTSALLRFAKKTNIPVILIGHVTKSGDIAGPRVLEHIVDVVLYMEGEKYSSHRLLRSAKNRYGSTDELGVFEMSQLGLQAVSNPSEMFLREQYSDSEVLAGLAIAVVMDGSRTFVIEIQALCVAGSSVSRQVNGVQIGRAEMIISVLMKQAGLRLQENGIFLNVVSGVTLMETAGDLAVAAAICSSFLEFPIPSDVAFVGEIGLGGELRMVPRMEKRINTIEKLGYKKCIVPKSAEKFIIAEGFGAIEICGCRNLKEMINTVFRIG